MPHALRFTGPEGATVEGLLVPFGSRDSYGTVFDEDTEFFLSMYPSRPLLWHHSLDAQVGAEVIGRIDELEVTPRGVMMRAILNTAGKWFGKVRDSIRRGAVGLSSGALAHMVKIDEYSGRVLQWPIAEGSLTPAPSNPDAVIVHHTVRGDLARAHFRAAGLPFDAPTPPLGGADPSRPWHSFPYPGSPLQHRARREVAAGRRVLLREDARRELEAGRRCLLLAAAREELRACRCLLDELDPGAR